MNTTNALSNAEVLRTVTVNHMVDGFKSYVKGWPTKFAGPVPSSEAFMVALLFGKQRKPGPEAGFVAMQLRPEGASVAELSAAFNSGPAHNHSRELSADNKGQGLHYFTRTKGAGRFYLQFTAKGIKALEKALQGMAAQTAAGETTVAADKPKAKKATGAKVGKKPTSDAPKAKPAKVWVSTGDGGGHYADPPKKPRKGKAATEPELNAQHEATIVERELEGPIDPVKPIDQPNA